MTERAKLAAAELTSRGWAIDDDLIKDCAKCGYGVSNGMRYCPQCGARVPLSFEASALDDIEAALVAADDLTLAEMRAERDKLLVTLGNESRRPCAREEDCVMQPHCGHDGKCKRPEWDGK